MVIVNLNSQLGNQMFQYALYRKLIWLNKNVKLDTRYYVKYPEHFGLSIFKLDLKIASIKEIQKVRDESRSYLPRFRRKLFGSNKSIFSEVDSDTLCYKPDVFQLSSAYIDGYWQTEMYFSDIRTILLKEFLFPIINNEKNKKVIKLIKNTNSISIHIRRGDYIGGFPIIQVEYYDKAIRYFEEKYKNVCFFVFSNDTFWARKNIKFKNGVFVDWNSGQDSFYDMYLMTQCQHNIIANSSFSWWGAWLNIHEKKEVIAPSIWLYHQKTPDVYCFGWKIM